MPYIQETVKTGKVIEKRKYYTARLDLKGIPRGDNHTPTSEEMEKANQDEAERKLRRILNANFQGGDLHLIAGYRGEINRTPEEARTDLEKFLRALRALFRKHELALKYITATERGVNGQRKIHHHLVINYIDVREIAKLWPWGRVQAFPLDDTGQYGKLANYIIKRTSKTFRTEGAYRKRWNASRSIVIPIPKKKIIKRKSWIKEPAALKGYYIEKEKTYNGFDRQGYPVQFYSMVKLERNKNDTKRNQGSSVGGRAQSRRQI